MNFLTSSEQLERVFEKYFQKSILLSVRDEQIKRGKFLLIKNCIIGNNYFYELTIERSKKLDLVRIPYPFSVEEHAEDNLIYMDYRLSTLFQNNKHLLEDITAWTNKVDIKNSNRLLDSILEIKFE